MFARRRAGFVAGAAALAATALCAVTLAAASEWQIAPQQLRATLVEAVAAALRPSVVARAGHGDGIDVPVAGPHLLDGLKPMEIARLVREEPDKLGSASLGVPTRGALWGAVQLQPSQFVEPASAQFAWGTHATIDSIQRAAAEVNRLYPNTPKLYVGDISNRRGGGLRPHRSHQSGLDADVGYYYKDGPAWYVPATADNLDLARTWALVEALIELGTVEYMFMDRSVQKLLRDYAVSIGEEAMYLTDVFQSELRGDTVIRHAAGHISHFHVRFEDAFAIDNGARLYPYLRGAGMVWLPPPGRPQGRMRVRLR
jgi:hypothetical protein